MANPIQPGTQPPAPELAPAYTGTAAELFATLAPEKQAATLQAREQRLQTEETLRIAEAQQAEQRGLVGALKAGGEALAEGAYAGTSALIRGPAALGYALTGSEALKDFVRETAPENLFPTISAGAAFATGGSGLQAAHAADDAGLAAAEARAARRREWETLTGIAETAGLIGGSIASTVAGAGLLSGVARGVGFAAPGAAELAFGGGALRQAGIGALEGAAQGATTPFSNGGNPTQWDVVGQALMGAAIGGALGGGTTALANKLAGRSILSGAPRAAEETLEDLQAQVFGKAPRHAQEDVVEDMVRQIDPEAPPGIARDALEAKEYVESRKAEINAKIAAAGKNPTKRLEAAEQAVADANRKLMSEAGRIDGTNWDKIPGYLRAALRDEYVDGARHELTGVTNKMLRGGDGIEEVLDTAVRKEAAVAANLEGIDETLAIGAAQSQLRDLRATFEATLGRESATQIGKSGKVTMSPEWRRYWRKFEAPIESMTITLNKADEILNETGSAAQAYMALDQVRRQMAEKLKVFSRGATSSDPVIGEPARALARWAEDTYVGRGGLVDHLADETIWGKQGASQKLVNAFRRDKIQAAQIAEGSIFKQTRTDIRGNAIFEADPEKLLSLLNKVDNREASLTVDKVRDYFRHQEELARAVKESYALGATELRHADDAIEAAQRAQKILATVERQSTTTLGRIVQSLIGKSIDRTTGAVAGLAGGGPIGAIVGAVALPVIQDTARALVQRLAVRHIAKAAGKAGEKVSFKLPRLGPQYVAGFSAGGVGGAAVAPHLFADTSQAPRQERLEQYAARTETINKIVSNPALAQQGIGFATKNMKAPTAFHGALAGTMTQKFATLKAEWPLGKSTSPFPNQAQASASDQQLRKANAMWEATVDPTSVFDDWSKGALDPEKASFARKQWPELFRLYRAAVWDQLTALPPKQMPPQPVLTQLDSLLGFGGALSPTIAPDFSKRFDAYAQQYAQQSGQQRSGGNLSLPTAQPTHAQRIARGGRSA